MKRSVASVLVFVLAYGLFWGLLVTRPTGAFAQGGASAAARAVPITGFRADFLDHWNYLEKRFVALAQAMPQEKYAWRPGEGVRSVSEVFLHVAGANFGFMAILGVQPPIELDHRTFEKSTTDRTKVVEYLKLSFDHVRQTVLKTSDADLEKSAKMFGHDTTVRVVLFTLATHLPEHLGQAIAYARMNGVAPPWTAERQAQQHEKPKP